MKNEIYPDQFSELVSICRSHLNGVITEKTSKKEKQKYGFMALEKLNDIEAVYHGLTPTSEVPHD